jgi:CheY-like chemotaxis protein
MNRQVLVVEDDKELGQSFYEVLSLEGNDVTLVSDGLEARQTLTHTVPDLILLDLHLPRFSGIDLLDEIQRNRQLHDVPVIVVTADAIRAEIVRDRVALVLLKPVSLMQILQLTQRFVRH